MSRVTELLRETKRAACSVCSLRSRSVLPTDRSVYATGPGACFSILESKGRALCASFMNSMVWEVRVQMAWAGQL